MQDAGCKGQWASSWVSVDIYVLHDMRHEEIGAFLHALAAEDCRG